jgi:hypothetical protein
MSARAIPLRTPASLIAALSTVRHLGRVALLLGALAALPAPAAAQLISVKTVPIAQGDQFDFFPSRNQGMASVSIALADTLLDPFSNPAKASRLQGSHFFGTPSFFSVSSNAGGGRTLPVTALARSHSLFGGAGLAFQEIDAAKRADFQPITFAPGFPAAPAKSHNNRYGFAMVGKAFPTMGFSVGASIFGAGLEAVDGVDLLYAGSQGIDQRGQSMDVRLGVLKEWSAARSLEAVIVHNRYRSRHDVTYADWFWDPETRTTVPRPRVDHNLDRTNTSGVHVAYVQPVNASWRIGGLLTANRLTHPKIPNYEIMNIPRDPGHSDAFNIGFGVAKMQSGATLALDAVYEPIRTSTWAEAASPTLTASGATIPLGGKTVENHFQFSNVLVRLGMSQDFVLADPGQQAGFQMGLAVRSIYYRLTQDNNVANATRRQTEQWVEWTPTWGTSFRFPGVEIRYRGRLTSGTGRPGVAQRGGGFVVDAAASSVPSIVAAPSGQLTLDEVRVMSHQLSVSFPIR